MYMFLTTLNSLASEQASPEGQAVFDRLLKACGEVVWKGDTTSILVLSQIQVDEPYQPENCKIISSTGKNSGLEDRSLDRVKKIVAASNRAGASNGS